MYIYRMPLQMYMYKSCSLHPSAYTQHASWLCLTYPQVAIYGGSMCACVRACAHECVCVCERERLSVCVHMCGWESACVCMCVCEYVRVLGMYVP